MTNTYGDLINSKAPARSMSKLVLVILSETFNGATAQLKTYFEVK